VTTVTATRSTPRYLPLIEAMALRTSGARPMTKFYSLFLAALLFAPAAYATLNQAALIIS
jgi:hypothetical protein